MPTILAKWTAEEAASDKAKMVLVYVYAKFKKIPKKIEKAVLAISDPVVLASIHDHLMESETLDEFTTALEKTCAKSCGGTDTRNADHHAKVGRTGLSRRKGKAKC